MKQKYIFFRNDDVFELTPNLKKLLRIFVLDKIPLTLSVIPEKITDDCSIYLKAICHKKNRLIEIAQHGLNHKNYSKNSEEKFEFGPRRKYIDQLRDISKGRRIIRSNFDRDPVIFVPPWNGFDCNTIKALQSENLKFFSTDIKHLASYQAGTLKQIFTNIYLNQKIADDLWITKNEFEVYKSIKLSKNNIFGIEMHDRHFGDADFIRLNRLIALLKKDRNIKLIPITHCEKYGRVEPSINPISLIYYLIYQFVPKPLCLFMYGNRSKTKSLFPYAFTPKHKIQKSNFNYFTTGLYSKLKGVVADFLPKNNRPIGLLLSGGIDSAALLHLIREVSDRKIYTITASYNQKSQHLYFADYLANKYSTCHKNIIIGPEAILELPQVYSKISENPIGDNGLLPTYLMVQKLSSDTNTIFSGEGADCLFLGLKLNFPSKKDKSNDCKYYFSNEVFLSKEDLRYYFYGNYGSIDTELPVRDVYNRIETRNILKKQVLMNLNFLANNRIDYLCQIQRLCDIKIVLPYLDKKFIDFALRIPSNFLIKDSEQKFVLKGAFRGKLPNKIIYSQKTGLTPPFCLWYTKNREFVIRMLLKSLSLGIPKEYIKYLLSIISQSDDYVKGMKIWTVLNLVCWYEHLEDGLKKSLSTT